MIRRPPRSTQSRSSAASDVYKRQSYNNNCESASLIPSRRAALLVSSALASPNASNSPQTVSIFTTKSADSSAELRWRFEVFRSSESSCTGRSSCARPPYKRSSSSQAPLPSGLPPCPHRATMAAADPLVDCARRNRRNVCCVDTFRTPCADPMSSLLSERPLWRNPVVAEGTVPSPLRILRQPVSMLPTYLASALKRLFRLAACVGLSPYSSRLTNLYTCELCVYVAVARSLAVHCL